MTKKINLLVAITVEIDQDIDINDVYMRINHELTYPINANTGEKIGGMCCFETIDAEICD